LPKVSDDLCVPNAHSDILADMHWLGILITGGVLVFVLFVVAVLWLAPTKGNRTGP